jgi:flagellar M-ring protein FliF
MLQPIQKQFTTYWSKQSRAQRIVIISLLVAAIILVPVLVTWASTPSYAVAYKGLSETDAGAVVDKLDSSGVAYKLQDGGTILVPSDQVYKVRLQMASSGLPKDTSVGFELFDQNTLGMTEFTQKVNYQRAMEGELERTIGSLEGVGAVRVHLVTPDKTLLSSEQDPSTASVTMKMKTGSILTAAQVRAISHLVASSVQGMKAENVVVVDTDGNLLSSGDTTDMAASAAQSDNQRAAETAAATDLRKRVQNMLDSFLGPNKAIVQASVAMDWSQKEVTSNTFDPTPQAVRSSQKIHEAYNANGVANGGVPGASSNLPTPVPQLTGTPAANYYDRTEETMNYEISQVQSKEVITPGRVNRVSLSVMVDKATVTDQTQVDAIKSAVAAAAGIDTTRGDSVVVEAYTFDRTYFDDQAAQLTKDAQTSQYMQYGLIGGGVLLLALSLWYFSRLIRNLRTSSKEAWRPILKPVGELTQLQAGAVGAGAMGQFESGLSMSAMSGLPQGNQQSQTSSTPASLEDVVVELSAPRPQTPVTSIEDEQRAKLITKMAEENPAMIAEIIQIWLNEDERKNG